MKMRVSVYILGLVIIILALGMGLPYVALNYMVFHGLSPWIGVPLAIFGILGAGLAIIIGLGMMGEVQFSSWSEKDKIQLRLLSEKISAYRARQRAMLEELDEIVSILKEIRDVLKMASEGINHGEEK